MPDITVRLLCDSPSSPLHLFIYKKETDHNSADNSAFDVFIRLTKCAHSAPKAMYHFKNVPRWTPGPRFNRRGRIREGNKCNHHWDWGDVDPPIFRCSGTSNFEPQLLGSTKIKKCRQMAYVLKWTQFYHIWHYYPNSSAINFSLTVNYLYHTFNTNW